jgi:hypothetical protein
MIEFGKSQAIVIYTPELRAMAGIIKILGLLFLIKKK